VLHHAYKGYEYLVLQMPIGHLCGYVKVPKDHPYFGKEYDLMNIDCHGGLTYASHHDGKPDIRIKNDYEKYYSKGFWIGFDYAHAGDYSFYSHSDDLHRLESITQPFEIEEECRHVINQLIKINNLPIHPSTKGEK
jgi:hypothetical protein